jgi:predicted GH43/DUF377 family glycosyl hydrolase
MKWGIVVPIIKYRNNPIISISNVTPSRSDFEVIGVFNAGTAILNDEIILLLRVSERPINKDENCVLSPIYDPIIDNIVIMKFDKSDEHYVFGDSRMIISCEQSYLTSMSHLRVAKSKNGYDFKIEDKPALFSQNEYEAFGIEDPRITEIDGQYYITYVSVSNCGVVTGLAKTSDFKSFERLGNIFAPDNKDVVIFPSMIGGMYYAIHRPSSSVLGKPEMWIASSPDLISWGNHKRVAALREDKFDNGRIGAGAVPIRTEEGWLEIYHGATKDNRYCLGAMLLDLKEPWKVLKRSNEPLIEPSEIYEKNGFFDNVVFSCGLIQFGNSIKIYYGASDESVAVVDMNVDDILDNLK